MVTCVFENKFQIDSYKNGHRINFKNTIYPKKIQKRRYN